MERITNLQILKNLSLIDQEVFELRFIKVFISEGLHQLEHDRHYGICIFVHQALDCLAPDLIVDFTKVRIIFHS